MFRGVKISAGKDVRWEEETTLIMFARPGKPRGGRGTWKQAINAQDARQLFISIVARIQ